MRSIPLFALSLLLFLFSCSAKITNTTAEESVGTFFLESAGEGQVKMRSTGFGRSVAEAGDDALKEIFKAVLFRGGGANFTALSRPMINSETKFSEEHPGWIDEFIESGIYRRFIAEDFGVREIATSKGRRVSRDVVLSYRTLRKYLEEEGLTRPLGY